MKHSEKLLEKYIRYVISFIQFEKWVKANCYGVRHLQAGATYNLTQLRKLRRRESQRKNDWIFRKVNY